jgi:hypothetical protein
MCPWCKNYTLEARTITIGEGADKYQQPVEPYYCSHCGAIEIDIYSIAKGFRPTPEEWRLGYYENLHRRDRSKDNTLERRERDRRPNNLDD